LLLLLNHRFGVSFSQTLLLHTYFLSTPAISDKSHICIIGVLQEDIREQAASVRTPFARDGEMELDFERLSNWMAYRGPQQHDIRISGHIIPHQLRRVLPTINARNMFPIHCEYPGLFGRALAR
jgi:mRNA degradation ribonuclease J1/J2